ncbi:MAG: metallophosphoesterase family protein [Lachnospiraceae bacterium]|nr:metallophosphoesterase family protein [Lachnospiraceae bacterium]
MKILCLSDQESPVLWDHFDENRPEGMELIISCGDLDPRYLSFLVTCSNLPLLYVHGNHDDRYNKIPPDGCICIDDKIYVHNGVRFLGLGGCRPYKPGKYMYTETEMQRRMTKLTHQIKKHGGFDVLVTHAAPRGLGDSDDMPHQGYESFFPFLEKYRPPYMIHGHMHKSYAYNFQREHHYEDTKIINAYEKYILDIDSPAEN